MRMPDGGFRPAFNLGFASDPRSGMIAAVTLDNSGSDKGQLRPMSERLAVAYGQRPGEHLVDGGFAKLADIEALAAAGVVVFAPVPKPRVAARDPHAPREGDGPGVAAWRQRMGSEAAKAVYKERAATAECVIEAALIVLIMRRSGTADAERWSGSASASSRAGAYG